MMKKALLAFVLCLFSFQPEIDAQVGVVPGTGTLFLTPQASSPAKTITYIGNNQINTSGTSFTFSSQSIGTASSDRVVLVVACFSSVNSSTISATIGGTSATSLISKQQQGDVNYSNGGIFALAVPSGTTADIVLSATATAGRASIGVYTLTGTSGSATPNSTSSAGLPAGSSSPITASISIPSGGAVLSGVCSSLNSGTWAGSWTYPTGDYDTNFTGNTAIGFGGAHANSVASSPQTASSAWSSGDMDRIALVNASF